MTKTAKWGDMAVVRITEYGPSPANSLVPGRAERPEPSGNELLVQVKGAGINPVDTKIRRGYLRAGVRIPSHRVLGMDVAGVVVAVGADVTGFAVGDEVYASPEHTKMGCYADYVLLDARHTALKPKRASFAEAAGLPLAGLTAWDALVRVGELKAGERVLIHAGAGGVGSLAIQLAKHLGATVVTTCSGRNRELCLSLGADEVVDYTTTDYVEAAGECDLVVDCLGPADAARALEFTKRGGRVVVLASGMPQHVERFGAILGALATVATIAALWLRARLRFGVRLYPVTRRASGDNLKRLAELVDAKVIVPLVDRTFPLEEAAEAHRYVETGRARGKVILLPEAA